MVIQSPSIGNLVAALNKAQTQFEKIIKDKSNPFFKSKYADLAAGIEATQPALIANGLAVVQLPICRENRVGVFTILTHTSGEFLGEGFTLPLAKQDAQTGVAAVTYARRAGYLGALGIAAEDDDGNKASRNDENEDPEPETRKPVRRTAKPENAVVETNIVHTGGKDVVTHTTVGDDVPPEDEKEGLRNRYSLLRTDLCKAGLVKRTAAAQLLAYLLKVTGATDAESVTRNQWNTFFEVVGAVKSGPGIAELVQLVENKGENK